MRIRSVVVGMDFSETSIVAARWAAEHFAPNADITLVHVVALPDRPAFADGAAARDRYDRIRRTP